SVAMRPHNLPLVMLGAALLWFGWFGFNAGSAYGADGLAGLAWLNTTTAAAAAILGWLLVERLRDGHATSLGAASGIVAGLVAITPAAGALSPLGAIALGAIAGVLSALAVGLKYRLGYDDSLDVVGVHLVAGLWGTIGIGFLATDGGLLHGNGPALLAVQVLIALVAVAISAVVTTVIALLLKSTMGWRVSADDEATGIDASVHAESGYDFGGVGATWVGSLIGSTGSLPATATRADDSSEVSS
ncbi:MAG: ammonium transporter, partial [Janibacter sp.]